MRVEGAIIRGYHRKDFEDSFERYLITTFSEEAGNNPQHATNPHDAPENGVSSVADKEIVTATLVSTPHNPHK